MFFIFWEFIDLQFDRSSQRIGTTFRSPHTGTDHQLFQGMLNKVSINAILLIFLQFLYSTDLVYPTCLLLIQSSFLFFYVRVFTLQNRKFRYAVFTLAGLSVAIFIATFFVAVFKCHPIAFNWNREIPGGSCINTKAFFISALALNTFNDVLIVLLPVPMIWRVQIPKSEKIALLAVFLFGGL